ncbi:hypothetical protein [Gemmatimonas aurantiaca]|uniref:hypothetical protein n=1 Tax=Gemmatimonas aurantiaca TaxID=173480 RepID=UPI00301DE8DC
MYQTIKKSAFSKARRLIDSGSDEDLTYACLELRFVLEALTYAKLQTFSDRIPPSVLAVWQPPQAMKALSEFEPDANRPVIVRFAPETPDGQLAAPLTVLGERKVIPLARLRKIYNSIGSYLHVATPTVNGVTHVDYVMLRRKLADFVAELQPVVDSTFESTLATIISFPCKRCKSVVVRNEKSARSLRRADCLNPACGAQYHLDEVDGGFIPKLMASDFQCVACGASTTVENRHLDIGFEFDCSACKIKHRIVGRQWQYGAEVEEKSSPSTEA